MPSQESQFGTRSRSAPRNVAQEDCMRENDTVCEGMPHTLLVRQEEQYKDRQGKRQQAWPQHVNSTSREDRWEDMRANNVLDGVKDKEVVAPPRKKVKSIEEEMSRGTRKALPTKFPPTMRTGDEVMQVKVPPQRKQPPRCSVIVIRIICVEGSSTAEAKGRWPRCDKTPHSAGLPSQSTNKKD